MGSEIPKQLMQHFVKPLEKKQSGMRGLQSSLHISRNCG